jgi:hypothetical protein
MKKATHVSINIPVLEAFSRISYEEPNNWESFPGHYTGPKIIDYVFSLDALNFCFWPHPTFDYPDLASNLKKILDISPNGLSPQTIQNFTEEDILKIFPPDFPNLGERLQKIRELGTVTVEKFGGDYVNLLSSCKNSVLTVIDS